MTVKYTALLVSLLALTPGCDGPDHPPAEVHQAPHQHASAGHSWVEVRPPGDLSLLELPARVQAGPESQLHVDVPFDGVVKSVAVEVGDRVVAGQPLMLIRSPSLSEAATIAAEAKTQIGTHTRRRDHLDGLRAEGLVDASAVFDLDMRLGSLEAQRRRALTLLESLGLSRADLRRIRREGVVTLRASTAGVVTEIQAHPGEAVSAGRALAVVRGEGRARVEVAYFDDLPGSLALEFVGLDQVRVPLRATPVARAVEPGLGRILAWFEPEDDREMADGMVGRVRVIELGEDVFEVPTRTLRMHEGKAHLLLRAADGDGADTVEPLAVDVLRSSGSMSLVRSQKLTVGTSVAADPATILAFGVDAEAMGGHSH